MGSSSGIAGLKCLQWVLRGIQLACSVVILGIYSYFLATMMHYNITIPSSTKAVEGIAAAGTAYTLLGVLLVCCCAGHAGTSFIAMVLDVGLAGAYVYVAAADRDGAGSCSGGSVSTPYGTGAASATPSAGGSGSSSGVVRLPTFGVACRMETACLAAACAGALLFLLSIAVEIGMNRGRHRASRPIRDADGEYVTKSEPDYAYPYYGLGGEGFAGQPPARVATPPQRREAPTRGFFGAFRRPTRRNPRSVRPVDPDMLPMHQQPQDCATRREPVAEQWGEVRSLHDSDVLEFNDGQAAREAEGPPVRFTSTTAPRPAADEYAEGDEYVAGQEYNLYHEDSRGRDLSETGRQKKQRESRAARVERLEAAYN